MQIHELTSKRRRTNEGVLGSIAAGAKTAMSAAAKVAGGAADVAGRSVMQKYGGASPALTGSAAQLGAAKLNAPLIQKMGQEMQKQWLTQSLPTLMAAQAATEPAQVTPQTQAEELKKLINKNLNFDYKSTRIDPQAQGGNAKVDADQKVKEIDAAIQKLITQPRAGSGQVKKAQQYTPEFTELATAMSALMNLQQFHSGGSTTAAARAVPTSATAQQFIKQSGLEPDQISSMQAIVAANRGALPPGLKEILGVK